MGTLLAAGLTALIALSTPSPLAALDSCFVVETADGGVGTGFLIGGDRIVTASHVVHGQSRVWLVTSAPDARRLVGTVVLDDPAADIAVIEPQTPVAAEALTIEPAAFPLGSTAFAIGSPIGGLVLSRGSVLDVREGLIETDTAVDPGNSGGPLLDEQGRVRGVVVQKDNSSGTALSVPASVLLATLSATATALPPAGEATVPESAANEIERSRGGVLVVALIAMVFILAVAALAFALAQRVERTRPARIVIRFDEEM